MTSPLSTIIWPAVTLTAGYRRRSSSANSQWVVAARPSSRPASATRNAPVQEPAILAPAACHLVSQGTQPRFSLNDAARSSSRPGTTTRSGAVTSAAAIDGCSRTPSRQLTMPAPSPASCTSNTRPAGRPVCGACERSALLSASISPAVPIDAVPDSAAITTETIDRIVGERPPAPALVTDLALKLSDQTLTVRPAHVVGCRWFPVEGSGC